MTSSRTRIGVLGAAFGAGLFVVLLHLWFLMVQDQPVWARRSYENRWAFRSVPSQRGALLDRFGRVLAHDEPTTRVSVYYLRFRLRHVVGAAVHGAMRWADQQPGRAGTIYGYRDGPLGPAAAGRDLLDAPVAVLRRGVLPKEAASELMRYATTVLAGCSGLSRRQVFAALRAAAQSGAPVGIGDVLATPRHELLAVYDERVQLLYELDRRLAEQQAARAARFGEVDAPPDGLIDTLEFLRRASLQKARVEWVENGETKQGSLKETVRRPFADDVSFEVAAVLVADADLHPGIDVEPAVRRVSVAAPDSALAELLGRVRSVDRTLGEDDPNGMRWVAHHVAAELPSEWLDELVPEGLVGSEAERAELQATALSRYGRELVARERRGAGGLEDAFDDVLMGRLGMRFVEHDARRREQLLWSHLRVESGEDVRLTIDVELQRVAEDAATAAYARFAPRYAGTDSLASLQAAVCVLDAATGDVLAYAGAPVDRRKAFGVPGLYWEGNGAIGSVVKPLLLAEHLDATRCGRDHVDSAAINECSGGIRYGDRMLRCDGQHWAEGRDPVVALAKSCNVFFYQVGLGLGADGIARALRRFGLLAPAGPGDPFAACWQPSVRGLVPAGAMPRMATSTIVPQRAIGYGVECTPVHVARAYAGLATGALPTVGLAAGERRPIVSLGELGDALEIVREGLRQCVQTGTARRLETLQALDVRGKTGTAEISSAGHNNAWFAGYLPWPSQGGVHLCFAAVVYWVPDKTHGGEAAGQLIVDLLRGLGADPALHARYLVPEGGR